MSGELKLPFYVIPYDKQFFMHFSRGVAETFDKYKIQKNEDNFSFWSLIAEYTGFDLPVEKAAASTERSSRKNPQEEKNLMKAVATFAFLVRLADPLAFFERFRSIMMTQHNVKKEGDDILCFHEQGRGVNLQNLFGHLSTFTMHFSRMVNLLNRDPKDFLVKAKTFWSKSQDTDRFVESLLHLGGIAGHFGKLLVHMDCLSALMGVPVNLESAVSQHTTDTAYASTLQNRNSELNEVFFWKDESWRSGNWEYLLKAVGFSVNGESNVLNKLSDAEKEMVKLPVRKTDEVCKKSILRIVIKKNNSMSHKFFLGGLEKVVTVEMAVKCVTENSETGSKPTHTPTRSRVRAHQREPTAGEHGSVLGKRGHDADPGDSRKQGRGRNVDETLDAFVPESDDDMGGAAANGAGGAAANGAGGAVASGAAGAAAVMAVDDGQDKLQGLLQLFETNARQVFADREENLQAELRLARTKALDQKKLIENLEEKLREYEVNPPCNQALERQVAELTENLDTMKEELAKNQAETVQKIRERDQTREKLTEATEKIVQLHEDLEKKTRDLEETRQDLQNLTECGRSIMTALEECSTSLKKRYDEHLSPFLAPTPQYALPQAPCQGSGSPGTFTQEIDAFSNRTTRWLTQTHDTITKQMLHYRSATRTGLIELRSKASKLGPLEQELDTLKKELAAAKEAAEKAREGAPTAEKEAAAKEAAEKQLAAAKEAAEKQLAAAKEAAEKQLAAAKEELAAAKEELAAAKEAAEKQPDDDSQKLNQILTTEARNAELEKKVASLEQEKSSLREDLKAAERAVELAKSDLAKGSHEHLLEKLEDSKKMTQFSTKIAEQAESCLSLTVRLQTTETDLARLKKLVNALFFRFSLDRQCHNNDDLIRLLELDPTDAENLRSTVTDANSPTPANTYTPPPAQYNGSVTAPPPPSNFD